jgi:hypothetical protein
LGRGLCRLPYQCTPSQIPGSISRRSAHFRCRCKPQIAHFQVRRVRIVPAGVLIPTTGEDDPIRRLFMRLLASTRADAFAIPFFSRCDLVAAIADGLRGVAARPPLGTRFTPRSLRSGGITAAYAVGVPLERIMRLSNHASVAVVMRQYLDPLVTPTPAARVFFQRFVPFSRSLPLPAAPVSPSVGNTSAAELSTMLRSGI